MTDTTAAARPMTVVGDFQLHFTVAVTNDNTRRRRAGVLEHVRERLLDDPVRGDGDTRRKRRRFAMNEEVDRKPRLAHMRHELLELRERGLWCVVGSLA